MNKLVIKNYTIFLDQELGAGNFATVYKTIDNKSGLLYAVKLLSKVQIQMDETRKESFEQELVAMQTKSEHIVKFIEMFEDREHYYIVQELCDGNLRQYLKKATWLQEDKAIRLLIEICIGIKALVRRNITHRDLKPENILLRQGRIKIADFGVSKKNLHNKCCFDIPAGSLTYMSLQALKGQKYTSKGDIWTIGLIFYQLLHGECPWYREGDNHRMLIKRIQTQKVRAKSILAPTTKSFLKACLEGDQENRLDWPEFFSHPIFKGCFKEYTEERKGMEKKRLDLLIDLGKRIASKDTKFIKAFGSFLNDKTQLPLSQFQDLLKWLDPTLNKHEIQYIFEDTDTNQDGTISIKELSLKIHECSQIFIQSSHKVPFGSQCNAFKISGNSETLQQYKEAKIDEVANKEELQCALRKMQEILSLKGQTLEFVYRKMATEGLKMNRQSFTVFIKKFSPGFADIQISDIFNLLAFNEGKTGFVKYEDFNRMYQKSLSNDLQQLKLIKKETAPAMFTSFHFKNTNPDTAMTVMSSSTTFSHEKGEDAMYIPYHQNACQRTQKMTTGVLGNFNKGFEGLKNGEEEQFKKLMFKHVDSGISTQNGSSMVKKNVKPKTMRAKASIILNEKDDDWAI